MPLENHDLRTTQSPAEVPPAGAVETALAGIQALPENTLILIPTRNLVLFPGTVSDSAPRMNGNSARNAK